MSQSQVTRQPYRCEQVVYSPGTCHQGCKLQECLHRHTFLLREEPNSGGIEIIVEDIMRGNLNSDEARFHQDGTTINDIATLANAGVIEEGEF